jgi:hypothetical protein
MITLETRADVNDWQATTSLPRDAARGNIDINVLQSHGSCADLQVTVSSTTERLQESANYDGLPRNWNAGGRALRLTGDSDAHPAIY